MDTSATVLVLWAFTQGLLLVCCFGFVYSALWPAAARRLRQRLRARALLFGLLFAGIALAGSIIHARGFSALGLESLVVGAALVGAVVLGTTLSRRRVAQARADRVVEERGSDDAARLARTEAESLAEVSRLISQSLNLEDVAPRIAHSVLQLLNAEHAAVLWLDPDTEELHTVAVASADPCAADGHGFGTGSALSALAVAERHTVWSRDVLTDPRLAVDDATRARLRNAPLRSALAVPLLVRHTVIGVLLVGSRERNYHDEEIRLAHAFADQAAVAIRNARLHEELRLRLTQSETLLAVSADLALATDVTDMMRRLSPKVGRAVRGDIVVALLADADRRSLRPAAGYDALTDTSTNVAIPEISLQGGDVFAQAWSRRAPAWSCDVHRDARVQSELLEWLPHRSHLFCPMIVGGEPVGGLFVAWREPRPIRREDIELIEGISRQASIALAHRQVVEELRIRQGRLVALLETSRELARIQPQDELLATMARGCAEVVAADSVSVRLVQGDDLVLACAWGDPELGKRLRPRLKIGESLSGRSVATGTTILLTDPTGTPWLIPEHRELGYRTWLSVPIKATNRVIGVLGIRSKQAHGLSQEAVAIAEAFASQAAVALENARLYREVKQARNRLYTLTKRVVEGQELERKHIARELHDEVGQVLTGLTFALKAAEVNRETAVLQANLEEADRLVHRLIDRIRGMSLDLRPPMLDDLGLVPALLSHLERYTALTSIQARLEHDGVADRRFSPVLEAAVYRIVQEALTNVARHSNSQEATVRLWTAGESLYLQVHDTGTGFDPEEVLGRERCNGLIGMQERAALLGGSLTIDAVLGAGVWVTAEFPVTISSMVEEGA